jgi:hypothetical protein
MTNMAQLKTCLEGAKLKSKLKALGSYASVFSTGGYNDFYLQFLEDSFSIQIHKTHEFFAYVVSAIDFLNRTTPDCFFDLPPQGSNQVAYVGQSKDNVTKW